ncbi:MAG: glycosyltransferase family 39 protein [Actinobacteria bacterium]|nr:glycosyltransferase family 39 protein [Actinomycetota bacterium]
MIAATRRNALLLVPALVGLSVRLLNVLWWRPTCEYNPLDWEPGGTPLLEHLERSRLPAPVECFNFGAGDANFYYGQGRMIAAGRGLGQPLQWLLLGDSAWHPSAAHPPSWPLTLALFNKLGLATITQQRLMAGVIGAVSVFLIGLAAKQITGRLRAGVVAASVAAVNPLFWISEGKLMSETMYVPAVTLIVMSSYSFWRRPRPATAVWLGAAIAFGQLTRAETGMLAFILVFPLAFLLRTRLSKKSCVTLGLLAFLTVQVLTLPWGLRNLTSFRNPVLGTSGTGTVLLQNSCDAAYEDPDFLGFTNIRCLTEDPEARAMLVNEGLMPGSDTDESEFDKRFREKAIEYIKAHPERTPVVVAARIGRAWGWGPQGTLTVDGGTDPPNSLFPTGFEERGYWPSLVGLAFYYGTLPAAVFGLAVLRRRHVPILPFVVLFVMYTITTVVSGALTRYRAGIDASLVILASVALDALWTWLDHRRSRTGRTRVSPQDDEVFTPAPS